ncbi:2-C-methyl-D-erythritol 4-phosphate cytidylyltransferase [Microbacterium sp. EYE_5]|uniref:2-C-methyl-D-erythritol 4-phosphate cytidylyltransferase n=1 Tax=unclassified Microbacterium TaxID=2609290 RepID=UPI0020051662|nr:MULTISPECIES: 2-C-methyl-D-erythritol 4-phosphate cytidylyltransferase [unclassified Microbacterium]MCK6081801.1 2-C-methyl-D-erythritol 4-phosphate cytidylyltransferase [Microbacterium sp. EYE_382]MCK6087071.1 2-C-methyl-D-erythritol 4-phosphate cytidylyltransferase [Microbacterium sp. EYE_384]MCK6124951.1 2-C-methyl-D-erythritol 4-phosphate cytidylyltransferase [Microbacterium sp. EYE_80]MCK6127834.1 2-C-methyl-D-erythritol 4-phosphate cytidylyltransferase [Microbacterium sp. EYE_79]MCK61
MSLTPVPRVAVIVVAAGSGSRLDAGAPKAFVGIDGRSILRHALAGVFAAPAAQVVVVAPADRVGDATTEVGEAAGERRDLASVVAGGDTRQASVAAGLRAVWPDVDVVLVHDAARALTPPEVFERVVAAVDGGADAVIPVLPVVDTLKRVDGPSVVDAVDRSVLAAAQTPQGFRRDALDAAYRDAAADHTDDAALLQAAGVRVRTVPGDERSFKITTQADLDRARALVAPAPSRPTGAPRVGMGTDVHAFGGDGDLWLAGLEWPGERALSGHSDGDAVAHAIVDAVLAAAGLGDIGTHFGTDKPEYAGAHAAAFLIRTRVLVADAGWVIGNVSVQVQAKRPRFAARRAEAERVLSDALGAPVSVSATTTDGLGYTGVGDGVAAFAVAIVVPA